MAVTLTAEELAAALRLGDSTEEMAEVAFILAYATQTVTRHVADAPDAVHNMAVRRLAGHLFDQPEAGRGDAYANGLRNSGAASMLLPYRIHRAGFAGDEPAASSPATAAANAITGLEIVGGNIVVTFGDGSMEDVPLPPAIGGLSVTGVVLNSTTGELDVTYSDGSVVSIVLPAGGGTIKWPGLP